MWSADEWRDYELLDCSDGERLERWGKRVFIRPDPQVIWHTPRRQELWRRADARYIRSKTGGGHWEYGLASGEKNQDKYKYQDKYQMGWPLRYKDLIFQVKPMNFKHMGLFPEQAVNWDFMIDKIKKATRINPDREIKILNLFAYTGGASIACAKAGANICHVDAAKGMVSWARENAKLSGLSDAPIRWITDDCLKFIRREIRRGNLYDAIIMDPPSYGRGPGGEIWKLEDNLYDFLKSCADILSKKPLFLIINSYTTGLAPSVLGYLLNSLIQSRYGGSCACDELGLPVTESRLILPCGATGRWENI